MNIKGFRKKRFFFFSPVDGEDAFSTYTNNCFESVIVNESVIEIESEIEIVSESEMQICLR